MGTMARAIFPRSTYRPRGRSYRRTRGNTAWRSGRYRSKQVAGAPAASGQISYSRVNYVRSRRFIRRPPGVGFSIMSLQSVNKFAAPSDNSQLAADQSFLPVSNTATRYDSLQSFINLLINAPATQALPTTSLGSYVFQSWQCEYKIVNVTLEDMECRMYWLVARNDMALGNQYDDITAIWDRYYAGRNPSLTGFGAFGVNTIGQRPPIKSSMFAANWRLIKQRKFSLAPGAQHVGTIKAQINKVLSLDNLGFYVGGAFNPYSTLKGISMRCLLVANSQPMSKSGALGTVGTPACALDCFFNQQYKGFHADINQTRLAIVVPPASSEVPGAGPFTMVDHDGDQTTTYATA